MTLLFDTSAVIGLTERMSPTLADLAVRATTPIIISPITLGELEHGVASSTDEQRAATLSVARATMQPEFFDPDAGARCYAVIRATRTGVETNDAWIAATAVTGGHQLVTQDDELADTVVRLDWSATPWNAPTVIHVPVGQ